jgi:hypothetical protein
MLTKRIVLGLVLASNILASSASAQSPSGDSRPVAGTWSGRETGLDGFGALAFSLYENGAVTMFDTRGTVTGSWSRNGTSVVITFADCQYVGSLNSAGNYLSGTAYFTSGPDRRQWSFSVQR